MAARSGSCVAATSNSSCSGSGMVGSVLGCRECDNCVSWCDTGLEGDRME